MEKNNMSAANEILQRAIGKRELRYGIMRVARSLLGWPAWIAGFIIFGYGLIRAGFEVIFASSEPGGLTMASLAYPASLGLLGLVGLGIIMIGLSIATPYQYDTFMPGVESERKCLHCGHSLEPERVFPGCSGCGNPLPLDFNTYLGRMISKMATIINVLVMIAAAIVFVVR